MNYNVKHRFLGRMLNDTCGKWNRTCRKAMVQVVLGGRIQNAKRGERGVNFVNFNDYPVLGFIQVLDPRIHKRQLHNESPEAEFTLQRDATNDRVTIVSEDPFIPLLFPSALRVPPPPPPSCPSSSHDKSRIKKKRRGKEKERARSK